MQFVLLRKVVQKAITLKANVRGKTFKQYSNGDDNGYDNDCKYTLKFSDFLPMNLILSWRLDMALMFHFYEKKEKNNFKAHCEGVESVNGSYFLITNKSFQVFIFWIFYKQKSHHSQSNYGHATKIHWIHFFVCSYQKNSFISSFHSTFCCSHST